MAAASDVSEENDRIETQGTSESSAKRIRAEFDETMFGIAEELDRIVVTESTAGVSSLPVLAHKSGMTPVVRVGGKRSSEEGMFNYPYGVAVDYQTGNIYVSDIHNNRVQVFDNNGRYLCKFEDKINCPCSIAISENRVFVSQYDSNCVSVHDLNGTIITLLGRIGGFPLDCPVGIAINEMNGDIYVCDSNDYIIQMFCKDILLKSQFGQGILEIPYDIKLTNEFIYVLSCYEPFLYSFTYDLTQTHNTAISSISKHLSCPNAFCIDGSGHFIISDHDQNAILIFSRQGELVHRITDGISSPNGVTLDSKGRILVCSDKSLLIF